MRIRHLLYFLPLLSIVSSCGSRESGAERGDMLQYAPQVNEVEAIALTKTDFQWQLLANGKLVASGRAGLPFQSAGTITELKVKNGQRVAKGEVIACLDRKEKELALESARISFEQAELNLYDNIAGQGFSARDTASVPEQVLAVAKTRSGYSAAKNALEKAQYDYDCTVLKAPFAGVVADIAYRQYDMTGSGPLCTLIDDKTFDVDFMVLESEFPNVSEGMEVRVAPFGSSGKEAKGRIVSINPTVDKNGQVLVKARITNPGTFVDGMNVRVIVQKSIPDKYVVPKSAVVIRDNQHVLFRYHDGRAMWTYVNVLMSNSEDYVVEANTERGATLGSGDSVIVSGNLNIADNSEVVLKTVE